MQKSKKWATVIRVKMPMVLIRKAFLNMRKNIADGYYFFMEFKI